MHHRWIKNLARRCSAAVLAGLMLLSVLPGASAQEPVSSTAPGTPAVSTPAPESTQAPLATEIPAATEAPAEETPAPTEAPAATETPAPTEAPAVTETPVPTETPAATATPAPTEPPAPTGTPEPTALPVEAKENGLPVAADWKFDESSVASGSIAGGDLVLKDQSGNGNDLRMETYGSADWTQYLSFSGDSMTGQGGSMVFNGDSAAKTGVDFITVDGAPINSQEFEQGYTMEFLYYFPEDWTAADSWMSLIARQGQNGGNPEGEQGTMYASISNCKEIQFITGNANGDHSMSSAAWSVSMDEGGVWYHIAIVSDGSEIATYVNGCEAFRDYENDAMDGMYADPADGRFRIGSSWWDGLDKFLQGSLQEIRITGAALNKSDWLVPNPEDYVGEFGSNAAYQLRDEDNYNIVLMPDTQNTVEYRPDVMDATVDELIASADELNIEAVVHLGDVVDDSGDAVQYNNAKDIFYQLPEAGMKFLVQPGNHDNWAGNGSSYWHYFGQDSKEYMALTSSYLTPKAWSGAMFVDAGSYTYMIISLACEGGKTSWNPTSGELEWFESMLQQYPNCPTIVTRHDIQNCSDTQPSAIKLSSEGEKLWDIVKKYPQVFMMVGGHSHGSGVEVLQNDAGQDVISILTDLQFAYNGGNGWLRYLEFDEDADKIYYSIYSPYAASLDESEKSFFDVNFLTGPGNEGEVSIDFETRFAGMAKEEPEAQTEGKWMTGEYHSHSIQSSDASEPYITVENALNAAFREDLEEMPAEAKVDNIQYGEAFDYFMLADHLRNSPRNPDGTANETARWSAIGAQQREIESLRAQGKYQDKLIYSGFEWDMMNLDHASVALLDETGTVPFQGIREFEWLFSYDTSADRFFGDEEALYGPRQNDKSDVNDTYAAVQWVADNYPDSFILPNHPSRHNNGNDVVDNGEVTIENLRVMNDISPDVVFGFEGMPGNQLDPSCELPADDIRAGADEMIAVTGGVWDALLSEGRRFYNFSNSDFHFKISSNEKYSSGYWASEFSRNWTWVEPGEDQQFTFSDVVEGMRSGNSYAVSGELISDLSFTVSGAGSSAAMGQDLDVYEGQDVTVTIRFKVPEHNNYESLFGTDTGIQVDNTPDLDHVDLIMGHVTGKVAQEDYSSTANTDASIVKSFDKAELDKALGEDGYYTLTYTTQADADMYFRVRGLSSSEVDANGDPVTHEREVTNDRPARFDYINDYNYSHLSFYANPVWVNVSDAPAEPTLTGITVTAQPAKTVYEEGECFDPAGMEITAAYSDGSSKQVTDYTWAPSGALTADDTVITVSWQGMNVQLAITVNQAQPQPTEKPQPTPTPNPGDQALSIRPGITSVPEGLKNTAFNTPEKIIAELYRVAAGVLPGLKSDDMEVYDITLMTQDEQGQWIPVSDEDFPADGVVVELPYPDGTGSKTHDFVVTHMFTTAQGGSKPGDVETPQVYETETGIRFVVKSLSPIGLGWVEQTADSGESGESGSGSDAPAATPAPVISEGASPKTGDNGVLAVAAVAVTAAAGLAALEFLRRRAKNEK